MLELQVLMLNINIGNNEELKENCKTLKEYMQFVEKVRSYREKDSLQRQEAVELAVTECIQEGILEKFLRGNRAEVVSVSIFEFDEEKEWKKIRETEYQYGIEDGMEQGIKQGIKQGMEQGINQGLVALILSLKKVYNDTDAIYQAVIENDVYKNVTKEQVFELLS